MNSQWRSVALRSACCLLTPTTIVAEKLHLDYDFPDNASVVLRDMHECWNAEGAVHSVLLNH